MASHDDTSSTPATPKPDRAATLFDFDHALSDARTIGDIITKLVNGALSGASDPHPSLFGLLAEELYGRLERVEEAGNILLRG